MVYVNHQYIKAVENITVRRIIFLLQWKIRSNVKEERWGTYLQKYGIFMFSLSYPGLYLHQH